MTSAVTVLKPEQRDEHVRSTLNALKKAVSRDFRGCQLSSEHLQQKIEKQLNSLYQELIGSY